MARYQQVEKGYNPDNFASPPAVVSNNPPSNNDRRFKYETDEYRDKIWAIFFYVHIVIMFAFAGMYGKNLINAMKNDSPDTTWNPGSMKNVIINLIFAAVAGIAFGMLWLKMMKTCKMMTLLKIYLGFMIVSTLGLFTVNFITGMIGLLFLALTIFWFWMVRSRIPFSEAILKASTQSLQDHSGAIFLSFPLAFVSVIWVGFWSFVTLAIFNEMNPPDQQVQSNNISMFYYFLLLVSLFWGSEVLKNVGHVTTAGTVASWWFLPHQPAPTYNALKRSLTTSFGSICLGSLLVAILKAMREILYQVERNARESGNGIAQCLICIARCCLGCIEQMIEYFNVYAFTHVAVYGYDYLTAAKSVKDLFTGKGFTMLINDDLTSWVLSLGMLLGGVVSALVSGLFAAAIISEWLVPLMAVGFIIGLFMTSLVTNPVASAVVTTFVCWAEDPQAMESGRPSWFQRIRDAANIHRPNWNTET